MSKIKVFQFTHAFCKDGGIETVLMNWYRCADKTKIQMDFGVLCTQKLHTDFVQEVREQGNVVLVGTAASMYQLFKRIPFYYHLFKYLKKTSCNIFQVHETDVPLLMLQCWVAKLAGVPHIYVLSHSSLPPNPSILNQMRRKLCRAIITFLGIKCLAVSRVAGEAMFGNIPFQVVHNGIHLEHFVYNPSIRKKVRQELGWENGLVIGHIGRMVYQKNPFFLLEVFKEIHARCPHARLAMIGNGPYETALRARVEEYGLTPYVQFLGIYTDVAKFYQAFDAFVFPSFFEGLSMALLEAQTSGLPCFVSDMITQESNICNTTVLSLKESPAAWADTILKVLQTFERKDGLPFVQQAGFDSKDTVKEIEKIYENCVQNTGHKSDK